MAKRAKRPDGLKKAPPRRPKTDDPLLKEWEDRRAARVAQLQRDSDSATEKVDQCHALLADEPKWIGEREERQAQLNTLLAKFPGLPKVSVQIAQLQREYGAAESEQALAIREVNLARAAYESLVEQGASALCESCGQGIPAATLEQYIDAAERRVMAAGGQLGTHKSRLSNIGAQLHELNSGGGAEREAIETSIEECRTSIAKYDRAVEAFKAVRANRDEAACLRDEADRTIAEVEKEENPFSGGI